MQKLFRVTVDISKKIPAPAFEVNTNDLKSVKLEITITNGQSLLDLTGVTPRINIRKPDNEVIFQDCEIADATAGKVQIVLENQAYLVPGTHTAEIACYKGNEITAITGTFSYKSVKGIMNDEAVESKSEFTAINRTLNEAERILEDLRENGGGAGVDQQARQKIEEVTTQLANTVKEVNGVKPTNGKVTLPIPEVDTSNLATKREVETKAEKTSVDSVNTRIDTLVIGSGNANAEVTDAHVSAAKNKTFTTVKNRFEEVELDVENTKINAANLFKNGDFSNGTTNWSAASTPALTMSVTDKVMTINYANLTSPFGILRQSVTPPSAGDKIYIAGTIRNNGKTPTMCALYLFGGVTTSNAGVITKDPFEWNEVSVIHTIPSAPTGTVYAGLRNYYYSVDDAKASTTDLKNMVCINLTTTFGAGKEPTAKEMDNLLHSLYQNRFFDGTVNLANNRNLIKGLLKEDESGSINQGTADNPHGLPSYHYENIRLATPRINVKQAYKTLSFGIMTDIHTTLENKAIMSSVEAGSAQVEDAGLDFIALLGDYVIGDLPKDQSLKLMNDVMVYSNLHAKCPVYAIKGNHDVNDHAVGWSGMNSAQRIERLITNKEYYQAVTKKCEKYGIVLDENNPYGSYFYKDFPQQKIRAIFVNTSLMRETNGVPNPNDYCYVGIEDNPQYDWLANKALKVDSGWAVAMFSHIPPISEEYMHNRGNVRIALNNMIKAFMNGTSGTTTNNPGQGTATYDFVSQGKREFIGHFMGHVHEDSYANLDGINYFISNSVTPQKRWDTSLEREAYGLKTLSQNNVIINRNTRTVNVIKTGTGIDYEFTW